VIYFANDPWSAEETGWGSWVATSAWLADVGGDYGVGSGAAYMGSVNLNQNAPASETDAQIQALIGGLFSTATLPQPDASNIYLIYFPLGSSVSGPTGGSSCVPGGFLGYHHWFNYGSTSVTYGVMVDCGGGLIDYNHPDPAATEIVSSHELMEAATDPFGLAYFANGTGADGYRIKDQSNPWFSIGDEVGDLCSGTSYQDPDAGFWAQRIWSNSAAQSATGSPCRPIPPGEVYYSLSGATKSVLVSPGRSVDFTLTGWSSAATNAWCLAGGPQAKPGYFNSTIALVSGNASTINNGDSLVVKLGVPSDAGPPPPDVSGDVGLTYGATWFVSTDCDGGVVSNWPIQLVIPPVGQICTPPTGGVVDSCARFALVCTSVGSGSSCQLPVEFGACAPSVGCEQPSDCVALQTADGGLQNVCAQPCQQSADCVDPTTNCQPIQGQNLCNAVYCGPGTSNGAGYFAACNNTGAGDGTCLPVQGSGGLYGLCVAGGSATVGGNCQGFRTGTGPGLCSVGSACLGYSSTGYACAPLCSTGVATANGGGPTCQSGDLCVPVGNA